MGVYRLIVYVIDAKFIFYELLMSITKIYIKKFTYWDGFWNIASLWSSFLFFIVNTMLNGSFIYFYVAVKMGYNFNIGINIDLFVGFVLYLWRFIEYVIRVSDRESLIIYRYCQYDNMMKITLIIIDLMQFDLNEISFEILQLVLD